jgi:MOSC domain-containing protein YiiM
VTPSWLHADAAEGLTWWEDQECRPVPPGSTGENLTLAGTCVTEAAVGVVWRVGSAVVQVTAPRIRCVKLGIRIGDGRFPQRFAHAGRLGAYLRILEHGEVGRRDAAEVLVEPDHRVTVALVARACHDDRGLAARILDAAAAHRRCPASRRRAVERPPPARQARVPRLRSARRRPHVR